MDLAGTPDSPGPAPQDPERSTPHPERPIPPLVAGRYRINQRLGGGGMGEVYRAWDEKLRRPVALKRLAPVRPADEARRRQLLQEARAASRLSHRAIVAVYDVIEDDGEIYIVEEYAPGESLRSRITEPIAAAAVLAFAEECADALVEASRKGIVHCDLKPENIVMTEEGRPRILDFGVAWRIATPDDATTTGVFPITEDAAGPRVVGTPAYLAPELLAGRAPDARADIFSLGIVLYEMLTTRNPFRQTTVLATLASIEHDEPPPPSARIAGVPPAVDALVLKMLAKNRDARHESPERLVVAIGEAQSSSGTRPPNLHRRPLRRAALAALLLAAGLLAAWLAVVLTQRAHPEYVASRPFRAAGDASNLSSLAGGMTEAVQALLAERHAIYLVDADADPGASRVLEGQLSRADDGLSLAYTIVDRQRAPLGGGTIAGDIADLFGFEDRVAKRIGRDLRRSLPLDPRAWLRRRPTRDGVAYELYLEARGFLRRYEDSRNVDVAVGLLERAVARDRRFALALAALGEAYWRRYEATAEESWARKAEETALAALEISPNRAEVHVALGMISLGTGKADRAAREFERALRIDPASDAARLGYARSLEATGRMDEAEKALRRVTDTRPDDRAAHKELGSYYLRRGQFDAALESFKRVVEITPLSATAHSNLGVIYQYADQNEKAIVEYQESVRLEPNYAAYSNLANLLRWEGRMEEAAQNFQRALTLDDHDYRVWGSLAGTYSEMPGRAADADSALRRAIDLGQRQLLINPNDAELLALLAEYYGEVREPVAARRYAERAHALAPDNAEVQAFIASAYENIGDRAQALAAIQRALRLGMSADTMRKEPALKKLVADPEFDRIVQETEAAAAAEKAPGESANAR